MARVGIFETPPRKYFKFDVDTEVELEYIDKKTLDRVIKSANEAAQKVKTPQGMVYDMFLGKKAVHGWRHIDQEKNPGHPGLLLPNGTPIAFTPENRNMMMTGSRDFSEFVFRNATNASAFLEDVPVEVVDDPATLEKLLEGLEGTDDVKN